MITRLPVGLLTASTVPLLGSRRTWVASLLRPKSARPPMLTLKLSPKSVSGRYVGPAASVVRKLVVFQTPPLAPATYTVLPDESDGSTARPPTRPALPCLTAGSRVV